MNKNLKRVMIVLLKEKEIISSWGISNVHMKGNVLSFQVDGFIYKGSICIVCNTSYCEARFANSKTIKCNALDLSKVLDAAIEKDENYLLNLETWLASQI